jgi:hypothetical protein
MEKTWPKTVVDFEDFLRGIGMACQLRAEQSVFGNKMLQYADAIVGVRIVSDRGVWFVEIADIASRPDEWYDAAILRDLLLGPGEDVLSLPTQIEFVEVKWQDIVSQFGAGLREETHARLAVLRKERAKRRFPGLDLGNSPT